MRLVCDTSVLIDFLRGDSRATQLLESRVQAGDELWGVVVTRAELLAGMRSAERTRTRRLLDVLAWVEIDIALADRAGDLARRYARSHPGIETADYLIAACLLLAMFLVGSRRSRATPETSKESAARGVARRSESAAPGPREVLVLHLPGVVEDMRAGYQRIPGSRCQDSRHRAPEHRAPRSIRAMYKPSRR